jgi:predicted regulator of Ras-like GTPase activity (Roadblock/LC7/MglB family)
MSRIHDALTDLRGVPGVKGAAVLTQDGLVAAASLENAASAETLAGIASWLLMTTVKILRDGGMGGMHRLVVQATHGKAVLIDLQESCLVVMLDQFTDADQAAAEIDEAALRIRRASRVR